jgi:hypothetical protein
MASKTDEFVKKYIELRDKIDKLNDEHSEKMKPFFEAKEKLENFFLVALDAAGADSIRCPDGTFFRASKKSVTIADKQVFWEYILTHKDFDMLDVRANPTMVSEHIDKHGNPPPGVNYSVRQSVNVRRPTAKGVK